MYCGCIDPVESWSVRLSHIECLRACRLVWPWVQDAGFLFAKKDGDDDQGWLNSYFHTHSGRQCLRNTWNYKPYWGHAQQEQVNLIHFHGPKPHTFWLPCMAHPTPPTCPTELGGAARSRPELSKHPYLLLFTIGITADRGALATASVRMYQRMLDASGFLGGGVRTSRDRVRVAL